MRKELIVGAALALSLTGCDIYFGPSSNSSCGLFEPCDDDFWPEPPPPGNPGGFCASDFDCAAGCYCELPDNAAGDPSVGGTCVETGFCDTANDCPVDFTCQLDRATCVPQFDEPPPPPTSCTDTGCPAGTACDAATGQCVPAPGCSGVNGDCPPGFECAPDGTCVPVACQGDADCLGGCACDTGTGACEETGFCTVDADCPDWCDASGECTPMECDTDRATCTWGQSPATGSCNGPLTCAQAAPICPAGETAEILDGCYTGSCLVTADCDVPPLARCDRIENPNQCTNRPDCEVHYDGMDCTCGGAPCDCANPPSDENGDPMACTCSIWEYSCASI